MIFKSVLIYKPKIYRKLRLNENWLYRNSPT